jgi:hypothetical protein
MLVYIEIFPTIQVPHFHTWFIQFHGIIMYGSVFMCCIEHVPYKAYTDLGLLIFIYLVTLVIGAHMYLCLFICVMVANNSGV